MVLMRASASKYSAIQSCGSIWVVKGLAQQAQGLQKPPGRAGQSTSG